MFLVCEPQCVGPEHVGFNASFLAALRCGLPGRPILFLAEPEHLRLVGRVLEAQRIGGVELRRLEIPPRHQGGVRRLGRDLPLHRGVLELAKASGAADVIFSSVSTTGLTALKLLLRPDSPRTTVIPHALLEWMKPSPGQRGRAWFTSVVAAANPLQLRWLLLSPSIETRLLELAPHLRGATAAIEHPYFFAPLGAFEPFRNGQVRFGSIGQAHRSKGLATLVALARGIRGSPGGGRASFVHIGPVADPALASEARGAVEFPATEGFLSRQAFSDAIEAIDYALFCYPGDSYRLNVSGALFDALAHGKPVVALRNDYFAHVFGKLGDIGHLCADQQELDATLRRLVAERPVAEYLAQRARIAGTRQAFSPQAVGESLGRLFGR